MEEEEEVSEGEDVKGKENEEERQVERSPGSSSESVPTIAPSLPSRDVLSVHSRLSTMSRATMVSFSESSSRSGSIREPLPPPPEEAPVRIESAHSVIQPEVRPSSVSVLRVGQTKKKPSLKPGKPPLTPSTISVITKVSRVLKAKEVEEKSEEIAPKSREDSPQPVVDKSTVEMMKPPLDKQSLYSKYSQPLKTPELEQKVSAESVLKERKEDEGAPTDTSALSSKSLTKLSAFKELGRIFNDVYADEMTIMPISSADWNSSNSNPAFSLARTSQTESGVEFKVLVTSSSIPEKALQKLKSCHLRFVQKEDSPENILSKARHADAIFLAGKKVTINRKFLNNIVGEKLKVVATMNSSYDELDVTELTRRNIKMARSEGGSEDWVAEAAIGLALAAGHRVKEAAFHMSKGVDNSEDVRWLVGLEMRSSVCGLVGAGPLCSALAERFAALGVQSVLSWSPSPKHRVKMSHDSKFSQPEEVTSMTKSWSTVSQEKGMSFRQSSFGSVLKKSDYIFIFCPYTWKTKNLFNYNIFKSMKRTAVLVNVGHGGVINNDDLAKALEEGLLWAAGMDVTYPEPLPPDHKLLHLHNCIISGHIGTGILELRERQAEVAAENILAALEGRKMPNEVCFKSTKK